MSVAGASPAREPSVLERALGADVERLHPELRRRVATGAGAGYACVGRGVMRTVRVGPSWLPLAWGRAIARLLARLGLELPSPGRDVPFTLVNEPGRDDRGRDVLVYDRRFGGDGDRAERFRSRSVWTGTELVDELDDRGRLLAPARVRADADGGVVFTSPRLALAVGRRRLPLPVLLTGRTLARERFDEESGRFRITVALQHPILGLVVGYDGGFTCAYPPLDGAGGPPEAWEPPHRALA